MYLALNEEWPYEYFPRHEVTCKCGCGLLPSDSVMKKAVLIRKTTGIVMIVTSGARCPAYNKKIGSKSLAHTIGALDVKVSGRDVYRLVAEAIKQGMTGIGVDQKSSTPHKSRYVHLDDLKDSSVTPRPMLWSY